MASCFTLFWKMKVFIWDPSFKIYVFSRKQCAWGRVPQTGQGSRKVQSAVEIFRWKVKGSPKSRGILHLLGAINVYLIDVEIFHSIRGNFYLLVALDEDIAGNPSNRCRDISVWIWAIPRENLQTCAWKQTCKFAFVLTVTTIFPQLNCKNSGVGRNLAFLSADWSIN